jgi:hypothetical protein
MEHVRALERLSSHRISKLNPRNRKVSRFLDLEPFDVIVIHYSILVISDQYLSPALRDRIHRFRGLKVQFIQDEYRWVDRITEMIRYLGIHVLYTCIPEPAASQVYEARLPEVARVPTLAGYVPQSLLGRSVPPIRERPLDVSYRGQTVPYWLGRLGQDKIVIGRVVRDRVARYGLVSDIAWDPDERIYGEEWYRFTLASKTALGTESGASIVDFDGSLQRRVDDYLAEHPDADFEEVHSRILAPYEGNVVISVVSPRVFEAAALNTALVLFPGHHSGVIEPWEHYVPLEKDFSNFAQVADLLHQPDVLQGMADRTYADLVTSGRYSLSRFVREFDDLLAEHAAPSGVRVGFAFAVARADTALSRAITARLRRLLPLRLAADAFKLRDIFSSPALRRLFFRHLQVGLRRRSVTTRQVLADLRKLEMIRRVQLGEFGATPLRLEASIDSAHRQLTLRTMPGGAPARQKGDEGVATAVRRGEVQTILWDCSEARPVLVSRRNHWRGFVPSSVERFPALEQLARSAPEETAAALEASLFPSR